MARAATHERRQLAVTARPDTTTLAIILAAAVVAIALLSAARLVGALDHRHTFTLRSFAPTMAWFIAGWTLMLLVMMLPTATVLVTAVGRLGKSRRSGARLQLATTIGYLAIWAAV